jgi:hypothetical protein
MQITMRLHSSIALAAVAAVLTTPAVAEAKAHHHAKAHHSMARKHADDGLSTHEQLELAQQQISQMQAQLNTLQTRMAQASSPPPVDNSAQLAAVDAKADHAISVASDAKAAVTKTDQTVGLMKWAANTQVSGRMFFNESNIHQTRAGLANAASGTGFNIKRMYLGIDHQFSPVFSASLLMDVSNVIGQTANANFQTPSATAPASNLAGTCTTAVPCAINNEALIGKGFYVKNAFVQAKLDPALVIRAGAAPLPWIPFVEGYYGYRHIENTLVDRLGYGSTADWGVHVQGDLANKLISYQVSVVDGGGFRNVKVTKAVDVEGRVSMQYKGLWGAVGGYLGKRGNETQAVPSAAGIITPTTFHKAKRFDAAGGYKTDKFGIGGEYFYAKDWNNVAVDPSKNAYSQDSAQGWSAFANYNVIPKWSVFGKYEWAQPNRITDSALRDHYFNVGVQWEPVKIVDIALVYKREVVNNGAVSSTNGVVGCTTSATANAFSSGASRLSAICAGNGTYDEVGIFGQFKF